MIQLTNEGGLFLADFSIRYRNQSKYNSIQLVIDTGALITVISPIITDFLGYSIRDSSGISRLDGASGISEGYILKIPSICCMGYEIKNFEVACHDINSRLGVTGLLGMNFFSNFRIDIDFMNGKIYQIEKLN